MSADTELVLRESLALDLRRRSLQMVLRAWSSQRFAIITGTLPTYTPVVPVAAIRLQCEVVLNLLLEIRQVRRIQALQHALWVHDIQLVIFDLLIVDRLGWVYEAQRDGEPVDGLGATALDAQRSLLLRLLQHEAVLVGDPGLFCSIR